MKADFRTKPLEGIGNRKYLVDHQTGLSDTGMHWHDTIEIVHVESGTLRFYLNNTWYTLTTGDTILVPPQRIHYMFCRPEDETEKTVIGITVGLICEENIAEEEIFLPFKTDKINDHCIFRRNPLLAEKVSSLRKLPDSPVGALLTQSLILQLYACIYEIWLQQGLTFMDPLKDQTIGLLLQILQRDYAAPPTAYEMARQLHLSYSHMCRLLQKSLHTTYQDLLTSIRVEQAKKLLLSTSTPITEIALQCGFCDSSYFIRRFRSLVGTTPRKYRVEGSFYRP